MKLFNLPGLSVRSARILATLALFGWCAPAVWAAMTNSSSETSGILPRPEGLTYPTLVYEPPAPEQYRVALSNGPVAYIVPDHELPLATLTFYIHTGNYLQPKGKEGLTDLLGYLLAHGGTASQSADALEERLAFLAAQLHADIDDTQGRVSLNLLSKDLDEGLGLVREVLASPRLQEDKLALGKQQLLQEMAQRNDDTSDIEEREAGFLSFGQDFWANRYPTLASVQSISQADLKAFHQECFFPSNMVLAVNGDFERDAMIQKLERLFAHWPVSARPLPSIPTNTTFASSGTYLVNKPDVNQGRVDMLLPGILREDPDYFPVTVMNDILGGGGFTSRVVNRVRSDEGLAYDAHTRFSGGVYYPNVFSAGFQSKSRTVAFAASLIVQEMQSMAASPVSEAELSLSQRGFINRFPRTFATRTQIANTLAQDEFTGRYARDPGYWKEYRNRIQAVTAQDVQRVAVKYLKPERLVVLVVGNKDQILLGIPDHPVKLADLVAGRFTELPLRDPMTMKPIQRSAQR